jgi:phage terminase large subunit-like protein
VHQRRSPGDVAGWREFWRLPVGCEDFTAADWTAWHEWRCSALEARHGLGIHYDAAEADDHVDFARSLKLGLGEWAGRHFEPMAWQEHQILRPLFGYVRGDGTRLFREVFVYVPKKQGKSDLAAIIVNDQLFLEGEPGSEVYGAAKNSKQAALIFKRVHSMLKQEPDLMRQCKVLESSKKVNVPNPSGADSFYQVITADVGANEGPSVQCLSLDEIEQVPGKLFEVLTDGSTAARRQPIKFFTGTGGDDFSLPWYPMLGYAQGVEDGIVDDPTFLPVLYMVRDDENWNDPACRRRANPSLGVTITWEDMESEYAKALAMPHKQGSFKRRRLNMPVADDAVRFLPMGSWDACAPKDAEGRAIVTDLAALAAIRVRMLEDLKGRQCVGWLDLSSTTDLTTFGLLFPNPDGSVVVLPWVFLPSDNLDARGSIDRAQYRAWAEHGFLELTEGNRVDLRVVREHVNRVRADYVFREIAYDDWNAAGIETMLGEEDGFDMKPVPQNISHMSAPTKMLLRLVLGGDIDHGGNPVARYCADNLKVNVDSNERVRPDKGKATGRIDVVTGIIMALSRLVEMQEPQQESVYETRGAIFL